VLSLFVAGAYGAGERRRDTGRVVAGAALAMLILWYNEAWSAPFLAFAMQYVTVVGLVGGVLVMNRSVVDWTVQAIRRRFPAARAVMVAHAEAHLPSVLEMLGSIREFTLVGSLELAGSPGRTGDSSLWRLGELIEEKGADTVLLWTDLSPDEFAYAVDVALASGCRLLAEPRRWGVPGIEPREAWIDGHPLTELTTPSLQAWQMAVKRCMDVIGATAGLLLLAPLFVLVALAIRLDSAGPIFFRQERVGHGGRLFRILKFRSMVRDAESRVDELRGRNLYQDSRLFKVINDPRVTRVGRVIRRTSIDELPQLVNVLLGHMSLVGPRPPIPSEVLHYDERHFPRFTMKPGMTGPWQVAGRNEVTSFDEVIRLETEYIRSWSLARDFQILLQTVPVVLGARGAH
jgi:exopolysaccharide biosynthesis polyprenyl glycosylphosphotransferase